MYRIIFLCVIAILSASCSAGKKSIAEQFRQRLPEHNTETPVFSNAQPMGFMPEIADEVKEIHDYTVEILPSIQFIHREELPKEEKDTTKSEPVFEPLVLAGTATAAGGAALTILGALSLSPLLWIGAGLLVLSAILTMIGWKRIRKDPKKYKGEKFAIANYIIIGILGVASTFYVLYILFTI